MTALDILLRHGPLPAADVARALGMPLAEVYAFLVHAEAMGQAEIRCMDYRDQSRSCVWAPTPQAVTDDQLPPALRGGALEVF